MKTTRTHSRPASTPEPLRRGGLGLSALAALLCCGAALSAQVAPPAFTPLFDGTSLQGFEQRGGKARYAVADGCIVGTTVPATPNSFLCTKRHFGDFELSYEFKIDAELNSGVQIRSHSTKSYKNGRVHGYQVEIDPDLRRNRLWTGGIYEEGRRGWLQDLSRNEAARKAFKPGEWNAIRVRAVGDSLRTWVNGVAAADLVDSMTLTGFIALQVHGVGKRADPLTVRWRNLRIADLGRHVWKPLFDGKSLQGFGPAAAGFTVEDGALVARGRADRAEPSRVWLATPRRDRTLRLRFRVVKGRALLWFRAAAEDPRVGHYVEIDAGDGLGTVRGAGQQAPSARPGAALLRKTVRAKQWNVLTVSVHGPRVVVHANDARLVDFVGEASSSGTRWGLEIPGGQEAELQFAAVDELTPLPRPTVRR
ncbi:MAG: DUF1080 domain-containing protein [Planctomycetes bacterium]|nr:DUF1080 domain-containing protein [Planctomycetota bacterium]